MLFFLLINAVLHSCVVPFLAPGFQILLEVLLNCMAFSKEHCKPIPVLRGWRDLNSQRAKAHSQNRNLFQPSSADVYLFCHLFRHAFFLL